VLRKNLIRPKQNKKKLQKQNMILNGAIGIVGVFLMGFFVSFSKNLSHDGVPVEVTFPEIKNQPKLAVDVYKKNPIQNIKIEVLNGCGEKGLAAVASKFFRMNKIDVVRADNAEHHDYLNTIIIQRNENIKSLDMVTKSFGISNTDKERIKIIPDETLGVDVTVILGKDYQLFPEFNDFISTK